MKKVCFLSVTLSLSGCSILGPDIAHMSPYEREVDCSELVSPKPTDGNRKYIEITSSRGKKLKVVSFGTDLNPKVLTLRYGKDCPVINIHDDVSEIKRINDSTHRVTLKNGKVIKVGKYLGSPSNGPYSLADWERSTVIEKEPGVVGFTEHANSYGIIPFDNFDRLVVTDIPVSKKTLTSLVKFNEQIKKDAEESKKQRKIEAEERRLRKLEQEKKAAEEQRQRELARETELKLKYIIMQNPANIGSQICMNGTLDYSTFVGYTFGDPTYFSRSVPGQLQAVLEGSSQNGERIKLRMSGWATTTAEIVYNPAQPPTMNGLSSRAGVIHWDNSVNWDFCTP